MPKKTSKKPCSPIPKPCVKEVTKALSSLSVTTSNYYIHEKILENIFKAMPDNTDIYAVYAKVVLLNKFYSTGIIDDFTVATHITKIPNIDKMIKGGDTKVVEEIAKVTLSNGKSRRFYSFATKYCSFANRLSYGTGRDDYPIYDTYVELMLMYFRDTYGFYRFSDNDLKNYVKFKEIVENFIKFFGLSGFTFKQIDKYLWSEGKNYF